MHQILRGCAPCGTLWTRLACAYPKMLCKAYGGLVGESIAAGNMSLVGIPRSPLNASSGISRAVARHWDEKPWTLAWKGRWQREEHINQLEMKVITGLAKHLGRSTPQWDQRFLVLCDSQAVIGACRKMRSGSHGLLRQLRTIAAVCLATGVRLALRWVPSERNWADNPSRGRSVAPPSGTNHDKAADEDLAAHSPRARYQAGWHL